MSSFVQFTFEDLLKLRKVSKVSFLNFNERNEELTLLRLVLGTAKVINHVTGASLKQYTNYCLLERAKWPIQSSKKLISYIGSEGIDVIQMSNYYTKSITFGNKKFFKNMLLEFSNYLHQTHKNSHTSAFLHLYRITELISFCFPLFYTSTSKNYEKTFKTLKKFFSNADDELNFFRQFVNNHLFQGNSILDLTLDIPIVAPNVNLQEQYYNAILKLCNKNTNITVTSSIRPSLITISRRGLTSLIFDLRNRYFHLATGGWQDNFDSSDIMQVDFFYKCINDIVCNWICVIYLEVIKSAYDNESKVVLI